MSRNRQVDQALVRLFNQGGEVKKNKKKEWDWLDHLKHQSRLFLGLESGEPTIDDSATRQQLATGAFADNTHAMAGQFDPEDPRYDIVADKDLQGRMKDNPFVGLGVKNIDEWKYANLPTNLLGVFEDNEGLLSSIGRSLTGNKRKNEAHVSQQFKETLDSSGQFDSAQKLTNATSIHEGGFHGSFKTLYEKHPEQFQWAVDKLKEEGLYDYVYGKSQYEDYEPSQEDFYNYGSHDFIYPASLDLVLGKSEGGDQTERAFRILNTAAVRADPSLMPKGYFINPETGYLEKQ